jgi:hypothetical protein
MEHVKRQLFSGFGVRDDAQDQCKDRLVRPFVQRMQGSLILRGDCLDERHPLGLGVE